MPEEREWVYRAVVRVGLVVCGIFGFRFDLQGLDNLPATGGAVLAINHVSYFDFVFTALAARHRGRLVRFLAKKAVFDSRVAGGAMAAMGHIPVDRGNGADAYARAVDALRAGELVGVFPESTISRSFVPRPLKSGAARMAMAAGVPLVPVVTWGGQRVWTVGRRPRFERRVPVTVVVDTPIAVGRDDTVEEVTDRLAERLSSLVDQTAVGYPDRTAGRGAWWMPQRLGGTAPTPAQADEAERAAIAHRRGAR